MLLTCNCMLVYFFCRLPMEDCKNAMLDLLQLCSKDIFINGTHLWDRMVYQLKAHQIKKTTKDTNDHGTNTW